MGLVNLLVIIAVIDY